MISKNQIKQLKSLHQKKFRDEEKLFIAEGIKTTDEIIENHAAVVNELFITDDYLQTRSSLLLKNKINYTLVTEQELEKISTLTTPNSSLAVCHYFGRPSAQFDFSTQYSLYLDDIRDPGNMGTILRIADWFGIPHIFCSPQTTDLYNPKTIQASMGAFLRVKVSYLELNELLRDQPVNVYGTLLTGKNIYKERLENGLIIIGNESAGINEKHLNTITHPVTIPAAHTNHTESLNAAMATAIVCSEFFRQLKN